MSSSFRRLALASQGLHRSHSFGEGLSGTQKAIEHLGYVQIDTIAVVERAHHHVLWNRVADYQLDHLNTLVNSKQIFEYWYHAASYLPIKDYRYVLPKMQSVRNGESQYFSRGDPHLMNEILARVQQEGRIRLRDLDKDLKGQHQGWWNSGPGRRSVEQLFMQGDLMIVERNGMEKVFDLRERCIPKHIDVSMPTLKEYALYLFYTTLRAHGIFTWKQVIHLQKGQLLRDAMREVIEEQIEEGLISVIKNQDGQTLYVETITLNQVLDVEWTVKILSPFDNAVIHRDRLKTLFGFDYKIECYVPASKRIYGYFSLPILYGDQLVARIDCKAHRQQKRLEVLSLHFEHNKNIDSALILSLLNDELKRFAQFNQCHLIEDSLINF